MTHVMLPVNGLSLPYFSLDGVEVVYFVVQFSHLDNSENDEIE